MNTVAIHVLAEAGIEGLDAEAALRCVLAELAGPSDAARRVIASLSLAAADLDPSNHRIATIVRRLAGAGLDAEAAHAIFGDRGAAAVMALVERVDRLEELQRPG